MGWLVEIPQGLDKTLKYIKAFLVPIKNNVILAYHWSIKMHTFMLLVIKSLNWPIIGYLYLYDIFYRHYTDL